jgi:transposase
LEFAKKYKLWGLNEWQRVIWSDETKICMFGSEGRKFYWARRGDPLQDHHIHPTVKFGGGAIFLWGCMTWNGIGYMAKIDSGLDGKLYREILAGELVDTLRWYRQEKQNVVFQQDNDPKHTAKETKKWLDNSGLNILNWPSQSPDLNPIEHLWVELKKRVKNRSTQPKNMDELWDAVQDEWEKIPPDFCQKLISTMPQRVADVIKVSGGHTRW